MTRLMERESSSLLMVQSTKVIMWQARNMERGWLRMLLAMFMKVAIAVTISME